MERRLTTSELRTRKDPNFGPEVASGPNTEPGPYEDPTLTPTVYQLH